MILELLPNVISRYSDIWFVFTPVFFSQNYSENTGQNIQTYVLYYYLILYPPPDILQQQNKKNIIIIDQVTYYTPSTY